MISYVRAAGTSLFWMPAARACPSSCTGEPISASWPPAQLETLADAAVPAVGPSSIDVPPRLTLLPTLSDGWSGRPGVSGFRPGNGARVLASLRLKLVRVDAPTANALTIELADAEASVSITTALELSIEGVLRMRHTITERPRPTPPCRTSSWRRRCDAAGARSRERDRRLHRALDPRTLAATRHASVTASGAARPGTGARATTTRFFSMAGTPGFGFRSGEVWATHLAWSGDKTIWAESSRSVSLAIGSWRAARSR